MPQQLLASQTAVEMSCRRPEKRSRQEEDVEADGDGDDFSIEDDDGIDAPIYQGVLTDIPVEDQIKFSGLMGKRPPVTPLSRYRLLGKSGLRVSPCLFSSPASHLYLFSLWWLSLCFWVVCCCLQCVLVQCTLARSGLLPLRL